MVYVLTVKKAEGYIKSKKVVITLEYHAQYHWWISFSWFDKSPSFFMFFFTANWYFSWLVKKYSLDLMFCHDVDVEPEQLHIWYLEAVKGLHPGSFNKKANVPYFKLTDEQKYIDQYIADKINESVEV